MESKVILGRILQKFIDVGEAQVNGYNKFEYIKHNDSGIWLTREAGADTQIPFSKIIVGIEAYQKDNLLYNLGPSALRNSGIKYISSPVFSLLHLLSKEDYL